VISTAAVSVGTSTILQNPVPGLPPH